MQIKPFICPFGGLQGEGAHTASSEGPCQALKDGDKHTGLPFASYQIKSNNAVTI